MSTIYNYFSANPDFLIRFVEFNNIDFKLFPITFEKINNSISIIYCKQNYLVFICISNENKIIFSLVIYI